MSTIQVRLCPTGRPTFDVWREFLRVPCYGESILHGDDRYVVVEVDWHEDGFPYVIAHAQDRPRARAALERCFGGGER